MKTFLQLMLVALFSFSVTACSDEPETPAEKAQEQMEEMADTATDAAEEAADAVEDAADSDGPVA